MKLSAGCIGNGRSTILYQYRRSRRSRGEIESPTQGRPCTAPLLEARRNSPLDHHNAILSLHGWSPEIDSSCIAISYLSVISKMPKRPHFKGHGTHLDTRGDPPEALTLVLMQQMRRTRTLSGLKLTIRVSDTKQVRADVGSGDGASYPMDAISLRTGDSR